MGVELNPGVGGATVATVLDGGEEYQRQIPNFLVSGTPTNVTSVVGLPVSILGSDVADAATDAGNPVKVGAVAISSPSATLNGNRVNLITDLSRRLRTICYQIEQPLPAGSNEIGKVQAQGDVADDDPDSGNPVKVGARAVSSFPTVGDGDRSNLITDTNSRLWTIVHAITSALPAGSNNIGTVVVDGVADDAPDSGNPVKIGARAVSSFSAVVADDRVDLIADLNRRLWTTVYAIDQELPAGTQLIGKTAAGLATDVMYDGTTGLTPKYQSIDNVDLGS
jgi:hypothetical protein